MDSRIDYSLRTIEESVQMLENLNGTVGAETSDVSARIKGCHSIIRNEINSIRYLPTNGHTEEEEKYKASPKIEAGRVMQGFTEGRMCHYVAYNYRHLAAIVIGHTGGINADLAVFTNMLNVNGLKNFGLQFHQSVAYSDTKEPGTWHWIEQV